MSARPVSAWPWLRPGDLAVVALILLGSAWGFHRGLGPVGARAVVYLDRKEVAWFTLAGPEKLERVETPLGTYVLGCGGGGVRMVSAPCPNGLCVRAGAARHAREEIICLPGRLRVAVEGGPGAGGLDGITY